MSIRPKKLRLIASVRSRGECGPRFRIASLTVAAWVAVLPAALAIRDPEVRRIFCKAELTDAELDQTARAITAQLSEAEDYLDKLASEAREEAVACAPNPDPLLALVHHTRQLSNW